MYIKIMQLNIATWKLSLNKKQLLKFALNTKNHISKYKDELNYSMKIIPGKPVLSPNGKLVLVQVWKG